MSATITPTAACPQCRGATFVIDEETGAARPCDCRQQRLSEAHIRRSGLPADLRLSWECVEPSAAPAVVEAAKRWAAGEARKGMFLFGPVGVGKTWIAAAAAWARLGVGRLRWLTGPELMSHLSLGFGHPLHDAAVLALTDASTGALVLDDIDKVRATEYGAQQLFCGIDTALTEGRPLILTSNLGLAKLAGRYPEPFGEAIASRIVGYCEVFEFGGQDRR